MKTINITLHTDNAFTLADQLRAMAERLDQVGEPALPALNRETAIYLNEELIGNMTVLGGGEHADE